MILHRSVTYSSLYPSEIPSLLKLRSFVRYDTTAGRDCYDTTDWTAQSLNLGRVSELQYLSSLIVDALICPWVCLFVSDLSQLTIIALVGGHACSWKCQALILAILVIGTTTVTDVRS